MSVIEAQARGRGRAAVVRGGTLGRSGVLSVALFLALPAIAFEQFLHTAPAAQAGSPGYESLYWLSDALFALPLAAAAVWVGGRIADRWGFGWSAWGVFARVGLISLAFALLLIPGWFLHDDLDGLAHTAAAASAHGGHSGHFHGGSDEVHWASDAVFRVLVLVPLAAGALWGGERIGRRMARGRGRAARLRVRAGVIAALLAGALMSAWFLEVAADAADSGRVSYANALGSSHARPRVAYSHDGFAMPYLGPISATAANADGSPAASLAHALRDGLAGQAVGLPVMFSCCWGLGEGAPRIDAGWDQPRRRRRDEPD